MVILILARKEIIANLYAVLDRYRCIGHIPGNDKPREQEHRPAILACPVARGKLEVFEEGESIVHGVNGGFGSFEAWQVL